MRSQSLSLFQTIRSPRKYTPLLLGVSVYSTNSVPLFTLNFKLSFLLLNLVMSLIGTVTSVWTWIMKKLVFKTVDEFLQDKDFSDLMQKSKIPTPRRFVSQVVSFYKCFLKKLLTSELATSSFARGLSSFDEVVVEVGNSAHYTDSIQLLCGYFVQQKWISPSVKPVIVSEYCSLVTKFRLDNVDNGSKEWMSFFSRYYELQSRAELFRLFRICCETLRSPCQAPLLFTVSLVGLKSDVSEFNCAVRSLQCSIESLFLASTSLPRAFALLDQGPGLMHKLKFSMWNLLSSSYFHKIGIRASLEAS